MAAAMHFDTHAFAQKLKAAGFNEKQVDTLIELARDTAPRDLVTNASLDTKLTMLEQRMTLKLGALIVAGVAFISALFSIMPIIGG